MRWGTYFCPFPNHGTINALVIFVQHKDDYFEHCVDYTTAPATDLSTYSPGANNPCYAGPDVPHLESWTDDVATEWPAEWSRGTDRKLPQWASNQWLAPPGSSPSSYVEGSLSQYYYANSGAAFASTATSTPRSTSPSTTAASTRTTRATSPTAASGSRTRSSATSTRTPRGSTSTSGSTGTRTGRT